jgi:hypothetical protein
MSSQENIDPASRPSRPAHRRVVGPASVSRPFHREQRQLSPEVVTISDSDDTMSDIGRGASPAPSSSGSSFNLPPGPSKPSVSIMSPIVKKEKALSVSDRMRRTAGFDGGCFVHIIIIHKVLIHWSMSKGTKMLGIVCLGRR